MSVAAALGASAPGSDSLSGPDLVDLASKALLVGALLYLTLRVLRRLQAGPALGGSRLAVIESRNLGPKATLHLVGIGDRRILVGVSPAGLVAVAELDVAEVPDLESRPRAAAALKAAADGPALAALARVRGLLS
jgi:flagellar biogenesis protein FliO